MRTRIALTLAATVLALPAAAQGEDEHRIPDVVLPPQVESMPNRPKPLLELGDPFLGAGALNRGFEVPTGAVLQPSFLLFGTYRSAFQSFDAGQTTVEWANRLDLFGNLQLSGTERVLVGIRPLDKNGAFSRYTFRPDRQRGGRSEFNSRITTLFFEGDLGEVLPNLDPTDSRTLDWGFAVGRQPLLFQEGLLVDDTIDSIGITRNTLLPSGTANLRLTGLWGFDDIDRNDNREDDSAHLFGLFAESDFEPTTVSFDAIWIDDTNDRSDALYFGASAVQRIGHWNTAFRAVASAPFRDKTAQTDGGVLLFSEISRHVRHSRDMVYANGFVGIEEFSSAARGPDRGGPLGRTGILFEAVGLGSYGSALGNRAEHSAGGALGWQLFLDGEKDDDLRHQLVLEVGGRSDTDGRNASAAALGARYQRAFGRRLVLRLDGFFSARESDSPSSGLRAELLIKF